MASKNLERLNYNIVKGTPEEQGVTLTLMKMGLQVYLEEFGVTDPNEVAGVMACVAQAAIPQEYIDCINEKFPRRPRP